MSDNSNQNTKSQDNKSSEIDLGDLFRMIGNAINKLFIFLRDVIIFILDLIVKALIIIRVHIVKFVIVGVLSVIIGFIIDSRQESIYGSTMYIEANYGSTRQLYSNINYYNGLAENADSTTLAGIFNISEREAGTLRRFTIEPDMTENEMLNAYNAFMKDADSTVVKGEIDFKRFKENLSPFDFKSHRISVFSVEKEVIPQLQEPIISQRIENNYIKKQKDVSLRNLDQVEKTLSNQLVRLDTLSEVYKELLRKDPKQARTDASGTYIQMAASNENKTKELELLELNERITNKIIEVNLEKELNADTINVLGDLSPGAEVENFYDSYLFKIPIVTLSILLLFILIRELNKYLNTYQEKRQLENV